jgi:hypothetical protein
MSTGYEHVVPPSSNVGAGHLAGSGLRGDPGVAPEVDLCAALARVLPVDRCAVVLAVDPARRVALPGSDAVLAHLTDLEETYLQGPASEVLAGGRPLAVDDLHGTEVERWSFLLDNGIRMLPVRSMLTVPLSPGNALLGTEPHGLGVLVVARDEVRPFDPLEVLVLLRAAATVAGLVSLRLQQGVLEADLVRQPDPVGSAVGMVMQRNALDASAAREWLRSRSIQAGATLRETATRLVASNLTAGVN